MITILWVKNSIQYSPIKTRYTERVNKLIMLRITLHVTNLFFKVFLGCWKHHTWYSYLSKYEVFIQAVCVYDRFFFNHFIYLSPPSVGIDEIMGCKNMPWLHTICALFFWTNIFRCLIFKNYISVWAILKVLYLGTGTLALSSCAKKCNRVSRTACTCNIALLQNMMKIKKNVHYK